MPLHNWLTEFLSKPNITVSVTTGLSTALDGSTGTTTSVTFNPMGSIVIMASGSWSSRDEANTGTVLTKEDIASTQLSAGLQALPSEAESSMTRSPQPLVPGDNRTSVSASGEYLSYAFAVTEFSVTASNTTADNVAPVGFDGRPSVPSESVSSRIIETLDECNSTPGF